MSQPTRHDYEFSGDEVEEAGRGVATKTHSNIGIFIRGDNVTSLDFTLQCSPMGEAWASFTYRAPESEDVFSIDETDLNDDGAVYIASNSYAVELIRPYIESVDADGLEVFIFLSGQTQRGVQFGRRINLPTQDD